MWKKALLHGIIAGLLAAVASIAYFILYQQALGTDFGKVVNAGSIGGLCLLGCLLMTLGLVLLEKKEYNQYIGLYYLAVFALSFVSMLGPFSVSLPVDTAKPELFPGLVVPMHFFPVCSFLSLSPFFQVRFAQRPSVSAPSNGPQTNPMRPGDDEATGSILPDKRKQI